MAYSLHEEFGKAASNFLKNIIPVALFIWLRDSPCSKFFFDIENGSYDKLYRRNKKGLKMNLMNH